MKKITNLIHLPNQHFSLDDLIAVEYCEDEFLNQVESIQEKVYLASSDEEGERLEKILSAVKKCNDFKVSLIVADWVFLSNCYCLTLNYDQLAQYPAFIQAEICPEIVLEIDVDSFCKWLIETTKSQLWDIEQELHEKYDSENSSYLNEMISEAEQFANRLNKYRAWDALDFYRSGGLVKIMVNNKIVRELHYDIDTSELKERYIFETLTNWLRSLSGEAFQNSGLIFFDTDFSLKI